MKTTTLKMAIAVAAFLCFLIPNMAKAQSFPAMYDIINNTACDLTFDMSFIDMNGNVCTSALNQTVQAGTTNNYTWGTCPSRKDIQITIGGVTLTKANLGPNTSVYTCGGSTYTIEWGYSNVKIY